MSDESNCIDDDSYIIRERKKIGFVFEIFKQLPTEPSHELAGFMSNKINQRRLGDVSVSDIKDTYKDFLNKKRDPKDMGDIDYLNRLSNIKSFRKKMQDDNRRLSYDPFKPNIRQTTNPIGNRLEM